VLSRATAKHRRAVSEARLAYEFSLNFHSNACFHACMAAEAALDNLAAALHEKIAQPNQESV